MTENLPNSTKESVYPGSSVNYKQNQLRETHTKIHSQIIKGQRDNLESSKRSDVSGSSIRQTTDFSPETMEARGNGRTHSRQWKEKTVSKSMKRNIQTYVYILNVNGINAPFKRPRLHERIRKHNSSIRCKRLTLQRHKEVRGKQWKRYYLQILTKRELQWL